MPPPHSAQWQGSKIDVLVRLSGAGAGASSPHEKFVVQLGITQGRNLKKLSFLERVCLHPGSHSHAKPNVPFEEALQVPFPQLTPLQIFSKIGEKIGGRALLAVEHGSRIKIREKIVKI